MSDVRDQRFYVRRHLRFGWRSLLLFTVLGVTLETAHGLKAQWYLAVENDTRRLLFTLAHAHGSVLAIVNLVFAATLAVVAPLRPRPRQLASVCLLSSNLLLPAGFFLGGVTTYGGDPGLGIALVPIGALLLIVAISTLVLAIRRIELAAEPTADHHKQARTTTSGR
jgi:hypothetical protein